MVAGRRYGTFLVSGHREGTESADLLTICFLHRCREAVILSPRLLGGRAPCSSLGDRGVPGILAEDVFDLVSVVMAQG